MESDDKNLKNIDRQFTSSLARGLQVLACFDAANPFLTNKEIALRTGIPSPTISRLTYTLTILGYLKHHRELGKYGQYALGKAVLSLAHPLLANLKLRQLARIPMRDLAENVHGWVSLGTCERFNMVYLETAIADGAFDVKPDVGQTFPIVVSAMGRAYLAALSISEREKIMNQLKIYYPNLVAEYQVQIDQSKIDYSRYGFCLSLGDYDKETYAVAVPFKQPNSNEIMIFNCAIRVKNKEKGLLIKKLKNEIGPALINMKNNIQHVM